MTREILFRGYYPVAHRWVYGGYLEFRDTVAIGEKKSSYILKQKKGRRFEYWLVDGFTVGQYSGFNDRYGKHLYHGDKVRLLDALDGSKGKDARVMYDKAGGEWVLEVFRLVQVQEGERWVKYKYTLAKSFIHERCVKVYNGTKERTIYDDYIKEKWGCEE